MIALAPEDHQPFLRAIAAQRGDDLPRLIYADFLEESGVPVNVARAHFIRAQIESEGLAPDSPRGRELRALLDRITDMFQEDFELELPIWVIEDCQYTYRRGFLDSVRLTLLRFVHHGAELFANYPLLGLQLATGFGSLPSYENWFDAFPFLSELRSLSFASNFYPLTSVSSFTSIPDTQPTAMFESLLSTRVLRQLRHLGIASNRINDDWIVRFVSQLDRAAFATTLRELDFADCLLITNAGAHALATARSLELIERLSLKNIQFDAAARALLRRRFGARVVF